MPASNLTRELIEAGLRQPASAEPLIDAAQAVEAARRALQAAASFGPGPQRDERLGDACAHLDAARHYVTAERLRSERAA